MSALSHCCQLAYKPKKEMAHLAEDKQLENGRRARPPHAALVATGYEQSQPLLEGRGVSQIMAEELQKGKEASQ